MYDTQNVGLITLGWWKNAMDDMRSDIETAVNVAFVG